MKGAVCMEIRFNLAGAERKPLLEAISGITGWAPVYKKAPTYAYAIHNYTLDKNGTLIYDERTDAAEVSGLLAALAARGFASEDAPDVADASVADVEDPALDASGDAADDGAVVGDASADSIQAAGTPAGIMTDEATPDRLSIEVPREGFSTAALDNLEKLVASKAALIRKAVGLSQSGGASDLQIEREDGRLRFPWFSPDASPQEVAAYTQFVAALCDMAKKQRRVIAKEKPADSEKFAFRCFLLRLGFIGDAYASARKILLQNLPGDGSFKSGKRRERDDAAAQAANAAGSGADSGGESGAGEDDSEAHGAEHARVEGNALAEVLADAELIYNVNRLFEEGVVGDAVTE